MRSADRRAKECRAGADAPLSVGVKGAGSCHCKEGARSGCRHRRATVAGCCRATVEDSVSGPDRCRGRDRVRPESVPTDSAAGRRFGYEENRFRLRSIKRRSNASMYQACLPRISIFASRGLRPQNARPIWLLPNLLRQRKFRAENPEVSKIREWVLLSVNNKERPEPIEFRPYAVNRTAYLNALPIAMKSSATSAAPPIRPPSTSSFEKSSGALPGFALPP